MARNPRNAGLRTQKVPASCLSVSGLLTCMWSTKRTALPSFVQLKRQEQEQEQTTRTIYITQSIKLPTDRSTAQDISFQPQARKAKQKQHPTDQAK